MSRRFTDRRPSLGAALPPDIFGRLVGEFQFASHVPLRGGHNTGRHIYLALKVPGGPFGGIFECAVNIRSDEGTNVLYTQRIEDLTAGGLPDFGFEESVKLTYGRGGAENDPEFMGLTDSEFQQIINDDLYNRIADQAQTCDRIVVYGVTYSGGDGIHDIHMNSGTDPSDTHARDDRDHEDGAIAFCFDLEAGGERKAFANWFFVKFATQHVQDV